MAARPSIRLPGAKNEETPVPAAELAADKNVQGGASLDGFSDFDFTHSPPSFQIDGDIDPVNAPAEEAAILFANGQDQQARTVLENALQARRSGPAERLWLMLFDLYRIIGEQFAFETMGIEYAREFEESPPIWRNEPEPAASGKASKSDAGRLFFKGDLLGGNAAAFDTARKALEKDGVLCLDMSRVKQADAEGCARLLELLLYARKSKRGIELRGREALIPLVKNAVEAGKNEAPAAGKEGWLLLLELFQQQGQQDVFEELAIAYAVIFEESPPSWDAGRVKAPEPAAPADDEKEEIGTGNDDAYVLSGEIKSSRFADLQTFAQVRDALLIDCEKLTRIDFVSAGALINALSSVRGEGKPITFHHPNYLVAELFQVVGLAGLATVVFAKH
ncbi:MAG: STAS domain-containing protein [Candidatus Accumulibacter sp.]|nr:STAS domain-containing protein [Accumulibacter sp.]